MHVHRSIGSSPSLSFVRYVISAVLIAAVIIVSPSTGQAQNNPSTTFFWESPGDPDLAGYRIYWRNAGQAYNTANKFIINNPAATTFSTSQLPEGTYYFQVTAVDLASNESLPSNEVTLYTFKPVLEAGPVAGRVFSVQLSTPGTVSPLLDSTVSGATSGNLRVTAKFALPATFELKVKAAGYLRRRFTSRSISDSAQLAALLAGDLDNNNLVNSLDWSMLSGDYFQSSRSSDFNSDGITNSVDLAFLSRNYFLAGD